MDISINVLVPIIVVFVLLAITVLIISCRFYLWNYITGRKHHYSKLSVPEKNKPQTIRPATPPHFSFRKEQQSAGLPIPLVSENNSFNTSNQFEFSGNVHRAQPAREIPPDSSSSGDLFHFGDSQSSSAYSSGRSRTSVNSRGDLYGNQPGKLDKSLKTRFKSEPILNTAFDRDTVVESKRRRFKRSKSKVTTVVTPAAGQLEFTLFYDPDERHLSVNIIQLNDIILKPESFIGILDVNTKNDYDKDSTHLLRNADNTLELCDISDTGFLIYVTLFPKKTYVKHTNVIFCENNAVFNEKFTIHGHSLEHLSQLYLCLHALCKFGRDGEPIVIGEVKVPLKRLKASQILPFMPNLSQPEDEITVDTYLKPIADLGSLEIFLSYNAMAQKLVIKIIQATGLPKFGMTGNPSVSIKMSVYYCNLRITKKTTSIQKRDRNPIFNETLEIQLSQDRIPECDVLFEIRHNGPMKCNVIGYVIVGYSAGGEGSKQWKHLLDFSDQGVVYKIMPNKPVGLN